MAIESLEPRFRSWLYLLLEMSPHCFGSQFPRLSNGHRDSTWLQRVKLDNTLWAPGKY